MVDSMVACENDLVRPSSGRTAIRCVSIPAAAPITQIAAAVASTGHPNVIPKTKARMVPAMTTVPCTKLNTPLAARMSVKLTAMRM